MNPIVGIVIPCYNSGHYLSEAIESAIAQTVPTQVVVVDDCSTDEATSIVIDQWRSVKNVTIVRHDHNRGLAASRNSGIEELSTEFILPIDADDRALPALCERALPILKNDSNVAIVSCDYRWFGQQEGIHPVPDLNGSFIPLLFGNTIPAGGSLFRRDDWLRVGGYAEELRFGEDWDFALRLLAGGRESRVIHEPLYEYRQHSLQMTRTNDGEQRRTHDLNVVRRNAGIWGAHAPELMSAYWSQQELLRSYQRRYKWINDSISLLAHSTKRLLGTAPQA